MGKTIAVFLRHGSRWDPNKSVREQPYWDEHAQFMDAMFDAGTVILGGPFADSSGTMVIVTAESMQAAQAMFCDDPWALKDILIAEEFKEWTIFLDSRKKD